MESGVITIETKKSKTETTNYYIPNKGILNIIEKQKNAYLNLNLGNKIPMLVQPKSFYRGHNGQEILGGFLFNDIKYKVPMIISNPQLDKSSDIHEKNIIYSTVNNLGRVGFKINLRVLDFILKYYTDFNLIKDPQVIHPLVIKRKTQKLNYREYLELESYNSQLKLEGDIIRLASLFSGIENFYIPLRIDNRGRLYCNVDYLNYQSVELAKALLLFSKSEKIYKTDEKAINYLKLYGANLYGNGLEKRSELDRLN
jgi:DNA-directed RNA polymerase